jgi:hypothetical protein
MFSLPSSSRWRSAPSGSRRGSLRLRHATTRTFGSGKATLNLFSHHREVSSSASSSHSPDESGQVQTEVKILSPEVSAYVSRQTRKSHSGGRRFDPDQLHHSFKQLDFRVGPDLSLHGEGWTKPEPPAYSRHFSRRQTGPVFFAVGTAWLQSPCRICNCSCARDHRGSSGSVALRFQDHRGHFSRRDSRHQRHHW